MRDVTLANELIGINNCWRV